MSRRRRRGFRPRTLLGRVFALAGLALAAYFGRDYLPSSPLPQANPGTAQTVAVVERVVDGDTLVISGGERIRLIGVDTPETKHPSKPPEPFGEEATAFTRRMAEGRQVELQFDPGESRDRYGRALAYVYVDGQFLNEAIIRAGLARALTSYPFSDVMKARFLAAEAAARAERRGIWSGLPAKTDVGQRASRRAG